ncbi:MAG TPA: RDD family protein [Candidatus Limnocylindrales bacterium]|jgi:uncharacterized RDD family membrane protein YckC|nr:RDD family protein [Candidatus Limnocylindrales bacterium]
MTDPTPAPEPGTPSSGWAAPPPQAPRAEAGPAGFVYADVPNRAIAYIIDAILVAIIVSIVGSILGSLGLAAATVTPGTLDIKINIVGVIVSGIVGALISAGYFIYTWTSMRATVGMRVLGMQIGNAGDGKTLTTDQAARRWLVIALPSLLSQVLFVIPLIGFLLGLLSIGWFIYLVYTTAKSPTKQGFHDVYAHTMVVKAARTAA